VAAEFRDQREHARVDARRQPVGLRSLVVAAKQPAGAAGQIGHVPAPLVQDQVQAGAQPVPTLLDRRDARVAAADIEGDGGGGKCFLQLAEP
jgi:hypothetical protein